jgi:uncharacterized membrane protein YphA (DoxX/SURF4 family)
VISKIWNHQYFGVFARVVLAAVWGYAGAIKLGEEGGARDAIAAYRLGLSGDVVSILGKLLPIVEVVLALLLLVGLFVRWSAFASVALFAVFIVGIAQVWARGYAIDCGCFGGGGDVDPEGRHLRYTLEILRDMIFIALAVRLACNPSTPFSLSTNSQTEEVK